MGFCSDVCILFFRMVGELFCLKLFVEVVFFYGG